MQNKEKLLVNCCRRFFLYNLTKEIFFLFFTVFCFKLTSFQCFTDENKHFLSFIIPCYNCEEYIEKAIQSIYQQHLGIPFEIVCTDDGSPDNTLEELYALALIHPEIKLCKHTINKGGGAARNICIQNSGSDLIFCLDSDNVLIENSVKHLIKEFDKEECDIVCFEKALYFKDDFTVIRNTTYYYVFNDEMKVKLYEGLSMLQAGHQPPSMGQTFMNKQSVLNPDFYNGYLN